jgi:hypothetical protein
LHAADQQIGLEGSAKKNKYNGDQITTLVFGVGVRRQGNKRRSTVHPLPDVCCPFKKHLPWMKL